MIYFKVPQVPEVCSPFCMVHYKDLNGNPQMKSLQFSYESYADLKKYQDNTNSRLKMFTCHPGHMTVLLGVGGTFLLGTPATYMFIKAIKKLLLCQ